MTVQCCVCRKVKEEEGWAEHAVQHGARVSHTYCPTCLEASMRAIQDESSSENQAVSVAI